MKIGKSKKSALIVAALMGSYMCAGSVGASNLFITVPSDYSTSNLAVITGSRVTDAVDTKSQVKIEGLNRDPATYAFRLNGKGMAYLRQYTYSTSDLLPARILSAETDWSETYPSGVVAKAANPHSAAGYGNYIYTGDYDLGTIAVSKISGTALQDLSDKAVNLMSDINKYDKQTYGTGDYKSAWVHGEGLCVKDGNLYVVASVNPKGGYDPYDDSYLMQYKINADGSLTYVSHTRSVRNPDSVQLQNYNDLFMHTGIGGYQNYGSGNTETTGITIATLSNGKLSEATTKKATMPSKPTSLGYDMRDMVVHPNGTVYILAYNLSGSGGGTDMALYKTTVSNLYSADPIDWEVVSDSQVLPDGSTASAWFNKIYAEYYTKRIWAEYGDNIVVYKDGAKTPTLSWTAQDMGNYYTFNSAMLLKTDEVTGTTAILSSSREEGLTSPSVTETKIVNTDATAKAGDYSDRITGTASDTAYSAVTTDNATYTFGADKTIMLRSGKWTDADKSNNILGAVYAHDGNDITVNATGHTLQLQVQNSIATPVGVYAGNGKNVTINADKLNIIIAQASGGNSLTNAVMNDGSKSKSSAITVNGDLNINMTGAYGGNGVAVQKTDRWGEASYAADTGVSHTITVNGNLKVKGADSDTWGIPLNYDNVYSRFNNAGILTQVQNSRVDVSGTADMDVYGNGITTNAAGSVVSVGGGEINVPKGMNYGYYTLAAYQGTINVNTGKNGTETGNKTVKLGGDIFALSTGTVNLALTDSDSYLRGIIDNGGTVNLTLQNGAQWINTKNNTRYSADNEDVGSGEVSRVTKLTGGEKGHEGVIFQKQESDALTVDSYSGNVMVIYGHNADKPTTIYGGDVTINTATAGSAITLSTDNTGIDTTNTKTTATVLDALAKKLYYAAYPAGESNLSGKVQIAEGLTAASASQVVGTVSFDSKTGQGGLGAIGEDTPEPTTKTPPEGDNTADKKDFVLDSGSWSGSNSGDNVSLTMKRSATWTGNNTGSEMTVSAEKSAWTGNNEGDKANITLDTSSWEGNTSGENSTVTLTNDSAWTGNNTGKNTHITIAKGSSWTGGNTAEGVTLTMQKDSLWIVKGDSVLENFETGSGARMLLAAAKTATTGGGATIDMTDDEGGNLSVNNYSGSATVLYKHDSADTTNISGGDLTIQKAASGSNISLLTDNTGLDMTNKIAIRNTLDALAKKLYYKEAASGTKNLTGTVKIAEGLTSASAAKFTGGISYDATTGQGSLDASTVDYGNIPTTQTSTTAFTTTITGDYVTDKAYRDAGVLPNEDNRYIFAVNNSSVRTQNNDGVNEAVNVAKDTTIIADGNYLTLYSRYGDAVTATGGTLTVKGAKSLTVTASSSSKVGINAAGGHIVIDGDSASISGGIKASGGGSVTAKNVYSLTKNITTEGTATVDISFLEGKSWSGTNAGTTTLSMNKGKWTGTNTGKLTATLTNGSTWSKANSGADSSITLDASTWTGTNEGANTKVILQNGATWKGNNTATGLAVSLNASSWEGASSASGSATLSENSTWTGASSGDNFALTLNGGTWKNTGASSFSSFTGNVGIVDMTNASAGDVSVANYSGSATVIYKHDASDPTNVSGGNFTIGKAASGSTITLLTDKTGVDTTDEDSIYNALNALAKKLYYTAYTTGERNLTGTVKIAEGLTAASAAKQTASVSYDSATGQASADKTTVNPGAVYPTEQDTAAFATQITGVHETDKEYRKHGVLSNTVDNNIYNFTMDASTITTVDSSIITAKDTQINFAGKTLSVKSTAGDAIATTGGKLTLSGGTINLSGTNAVNAANSEVAIDATEANLTGNVSASGTGKVTAKNVKKLTGDVSTEGDGTVNLTFGQSGTWTGNNSGRATATLSGSTWTGNNSGALNATLSDGAIWTGYSTGADMQLTLNASTWENTGASSVSKFMGTNGVIDMTNASAGNISVAEYSGSATVIYKHDASNPTNVSGGNFTVTKAAAGSSVTLQTDSSGVDTTNEDSIYNTLGALAKKLYYTAYMTGERNLTGTVKIAEGLTSASSALQTAAIVFDSTSGQGNVDTTTVTPGPTYPTSQDRSNFTTQITGDHTTDKEYRMAGVLSNTEDNHTYNFTKDTTKIATGDNAVVATAVDTKLNISGDFTAESTGDKGISATGGTLTLSGTGTVNTSVKKYGYSVYAENAKIVLDTAHVKLDSYIYATGEGAKITAKNVESMGSITTKNGATAEVTFADGVTWAGSNGGNSTISMKGGKWTGSNQSGGAGSIINLDGVEWSGSSSGKNSVLNLKNGTVWTKANNGTGTEIHLSGKSEWKGNNASGTDSVITLDDSTWSGVNQKKATVTLSNGSSWTQNNTAAESVISLNASSWTGSISGKNTTVNATNNSEWTGSVNTNYAGAVITLDKSAWTGNASAASTVSLANGSTWTGYAKNGNRWSSDPWNLSLTLNQSTWANTGDSEVTSLASDTGVIDMTGDTTGNISIANYSGNATVLYKHNAENPSEVLGGNVTITQAAEGSSVTLLTDDAGINIADEDSIYGALDALAKKLYYTNYATGERNLVGTVKIAEGLTRTSVAKQTASISFDGTTGQGGLNTSSVTPGPTYPTEQTKEEFTTSITGDYVADAEYRKAGVLDGMTETHTYDFTKDATTITTDGSSITTSTDTTVDAKNHNLTVSSTSGNAVDVTGGTLTVQNGNVLSFSGENAVKAKDADVTISGKSVTLTGDVNADNGTITVGEIAKLSGDAKTEPGGSADLTFAEGGNWTGDASGDITVSMKKGTWEGDSDGSLDATFTDQSTWKGKNKSVAATISLDNSTWEGDNVGTAADITLASGASWTGANQGNDTKVSLDASTWDGDNLGSASEIKAANKSTWTGDNKAAATLAITGNSVWTGTNTADDTALTLTSSTWNNTGASQVSTLTSSGGILNETNENAGDVSVGKLSGDLTVNYTHTADRTAEGTLDNVSYSGGNISVGEAEAGSTITLVTDRTGLESDSEKENMENLFRLLAQKLTYNGVADAPDNLTGKLEIAEGLTSPRAYGEMTFGENGLGGYKDGSLVRTDPEIIYGDSETAMMRGAKSAMAATALMWRAETNDLSKRMGDLRLSEGESGTWAKYYGGKNSYDSQKTDISVRYNAVQVGYDRAVGKNWKVGIAVSHNTGSESLGRGDGDFKSTGIGFYATRQNEDGTYLDIILKGARLTNEYTVYNDMGHRLEGDYGTWGLSVSAEYGKQFKTKSGLILAPSVEMILGRINGRSYDAESDFLDSAGQNKSMHVEQDGFNIAIARLAFGIGKQNKKSTLYTKFALAHEFAGDFKSTFSAEGEPTSGTKLDLSGTWFEWQLGGTAKLSDRAYFYGTFEKIFGGKTSGSDWRLDAGFRLSF